MLTIDRYIAAEVDSPSIAAAAMTADMVDHAMAGACVTLADMAAKSDATGHALESAVLRSAATWLQAETEAHRRIAAELVDRAGEKRNALAWALKARRKEMLATPQTAAPLFAMTRQWLSLALKRAALDEAEALLKSDSPMGLTAAGTVLQFMARNEQIGEAPKPASGSKSEEAEDADWLPQEAEHLLVDLTYAENAVWRARKRLGERTAQLAESVLGDKKSGTLDEREALGAKFSSLIRTVHRSELASLAGAIVTEERRRAKILRQLEAFPQLGEVVPPLDLAIEHDGERGLIVRAGAGKVFQLKLPAIIDRGVWRADGTYERGDAVTSDGSLWIAREDAPAHEPGKGPQWRLAVTRGRNGRDASTPKHLRTTP